MKNDNTNIRTNNQKCAKKHAAVVTFRYSLAIAAASLSLMLFANATSQAQAAGQPAGQPEIARRIGAIKAITANSITLAPDTGPEIAVTVQPNARLLRIAPGAKDLKDATPVQLQDLKVGDRIRVRGQGSADGASIAALEVIIISHSDLEARHEQERQDWQKRGLGGLVSAVDSATGTVTISVTSLGAKKDVAVHTSKTTVFRRYAPDSVKFDDAKTGTFRNVAGLINTVDASAGTLNVQDLLSKKPVQVKITSDSQLHKLPSEMANRIAMRLKGSMPPGTPGAGGGSGFAPAPAANGQQPGPPSVVPAPASGAPGSGGGTPGGGTYGGMRQGGGAPDFQQMLSRMPAVTLADLHKGDAVLVVTTQGTATGGGTAITLLSGVEPILQAAPSGSQAMMLAPWSLGGAPGGDAGP